MTCSIIVLQYNHADLTRQCISSLLTHTDRRHQIVVVDNCSTEPKAREVNKEFPEITMVHCPENGGFSKGNNTGARHATGEILLFLNNDTMIDADFVEALLARFERNEQVGIIGPRLLNEDGSFQLSAGRLPSVVREFCDKMIAFALEVRVPGLSRWIERQFRSPRSVEWVTGAALAIRRELFDRVGGFDESFFMFFEDKDLCARVRAAGFEIWYEPASTVTHLRGASANPRTAAIYRRSQITYYGKHRSPMEREMLSLYLRMTGKEPDGSATFGPPRH